MIEKRLHGGRKKIKNLFYFTQIAQICTDLIIFTWFEWNADDADLTDF